MEKAKSTRWAFTAFEGQWSLFEQFPAGGLITKWGWQTEECPETKRPHYQGWLQTSRQCRRAQLSELLPGVRLAVAENWNALINYCKKAETRIDDPVEATNKERIYRPEELLIWIASLREHDGDTSYERADDIRKWFKERNKREFKEGVAKILTQNIKLTTVFMNVAYEKMYVDYRDVFVKKADEEDRPMADPPAEDFIKKTDRQTDAQDALSAFLDDGAIRQKYMRSESE